jgi:hypothetical protein
VKGVTVAGGRLRCECCTRSLGFWYDTENTAKMVALVRAAVPLLDQESQESFIYTIFGPGGVKLGFSVDPVNRLANHMNEWKSQDLVPWFVVPGSDLMEQHMHRELAAHSIKTKKSTNGIRHREWYLRKDDVVNCMAQLLEVSFRTKLHAATARDWQIIRAKAS